MSKLFVKLKNKSAILGVIGLGYVGLPLAVEKAKSGYQTFGIDSDLSKINLINKGKSYINDVAYEDLKNVIDSKKLFVSDKFDYIKNIDCISICVPTPLDKHQQPDLSYVKNAVESILPYMHKDFLIVLESTTYPGTTREVILPILETSGLKCGQDFYLAFSPERVDPGNTFFKTSNIPKVVGGISPKCTDIATLMYELILDAPIVKVSSPEIAEMEKILENTYRNINIGLINEFAIISYKMGINIWEVIEAAKTKPYGFQAFYPGPGIGGHCIPLDPYYLSWKAREFGHHTQMIETSMTINDGMPKYIVERTSILLNRYGKSIKNSKILILGVAYKKNISDYRESPALKIIMELEKLDSEVEFFDPFVEKIVNYNISKIGLRKLTKDNIKNYDLVIILTDHQDVDYQIVIKYSKFIFDTRNVLKIKNNLNVELL